jgi:hypothetical protein
MATKFKDYPNAILLASGRYYNISDKQTRRIWSISWNHKIHLLLLSEITNQEVKSISVETAISILSERFLILNPNEDGHEILLNLSIENVSRNLKVELLKRPYHSCLDFQINSEMVYYGDCSPYYGYIGIIDDGETKKEYNGTYMDKYPIFIDYSPTRPRLQRGRPYYSVCNAMKSFPPIIVLASSQS